MKSKKGDKKLPAKSVPSQASTSLVPSDPLRLYLEELKKYPLLDPEEEIKLVSELKAAQAGTASDPRSAEAAKAAARRLVQANLRLVVKIALEYSNLYSNLLDLIQEGNIGLMKAVSKFDPTKGARLGYYAAWWIRSYILKYLLDNFRLVKIGTTQAQKKLFYHLLREKERLEAQGILAGPKLLAERLDVKESEVIEMQQRLFSGGAEVSMDTPISRDPDDASRTLSQVLPDERELPDSRLEREQLLELIEAKIPQFRTHLNAREVALLDERILSETPKTLQEVADLFGMTRERARQIEAGIIAKLRSLLFTNPKGK